MVGARKSRCQQLAFVHRDDVVQRLPNGAWQSFAATSTSASSLNRTLRKTSRLRCTSPARYPTRRRDLVVAGRVASAACARAGFDTAQTDRRSHVRSFVVVASSRHMLAQASDASALEWVTHLQYPGDSHCLSLPFSILWRLEATTTFSATRSALGLRRARRRSTMVRGLLLPRWTLCRSSVIARGSQGTQPFRHREVDSN